MRQAPRVSVILPVRLTAWGAAKQGRISDLSLRGVYVSLKDSGKNDKLVNLHFSLPPRGAQVKVLARVVRRTAGGLAAEFVDLDREGQAHLWEALLPHIPSRWSTCPFCGLKLTAGAGEKCPWCEKPLDFWRQGYWRGLAADFCPVPEMIATCPAMQQVFTLIHKVAPTDVPVLVTGASGTGKEMVAQAIHRRSRVADGPFVAVNCGAIPRELLEAELFGHEKGSFTGAYRTVRGTVEQAHGGTLFLDEVGELPLELQVKLLRFLQEHTFTRVGGRENLQVNIRVVSASNIPLRELMAGGRFREDLYYRLDVVNIDLPPLAARGEDILILAQIFLKRYAAQAGKELLGFSGDTPDYLQSYAWPGNIREMINRVRRAVIMAEGPWVGPEQLGFSPEQVKPRVWYEGLTFKEAKAEFERRLLAEVLERCRGNARLAAQSLKISRSVMYHLIQKYHLKPS